MPAAKGNTYTQNRKLNPTYSQERIDDIIEKLLKYANSDTGLYIATFTYEEYKQPSSWLYDLAKHHSDLNDALVIARELIAGKITRHCWIGDRNSTFGEKILPMYCKKYKALKEWQAELARQKDEQIKATADQIIQAIKDDKLLELLAQKDD